MEDQDQDPDPAKSVLDTVKSALQNPRAVLKIASITLGIACMVTLVTLTQVNSTISCDDNIHRWLMIYKLVGIWTCVLRFFVLSLFAYTTLRRGTTGPYIWAVVVESLAFLLYVYCFMWYSTRLEVGPPCPSGTKYEILKKPLWCTIGMTGSTVVFVGVIIFSAIMLRKKA
jgi:hypothetical protein